MERHYITKIKINKLRHLENIDINLSENQPKHLLLTGKNGVGKTTTLNTIKEWLKCIQNDYIKSVRICQNNIKKFSFELENESNEDKKINIKNELEKNYDTLNSLSNKHIDLNFSSDENQLNILYKHGKFILAYYGANRQTKVEIPKVVEKVGLKEVYSLDENPSNIFVKYLVDLKTQQSFARNENDLDVVENIEAWFNRFEKALRTILDDKSVKLKFEYKNYDFKIIQEAREPYGFNELSDGYSSIINIVSDLILRMDKNRAGKERNYGFDMEGIVLIDELETHLHIELQKKILPFLTDFFPNIQFIVTTHSPFVLNSIDNAVIYDLEKKIRIENLSAYSYEGIVEGYFEVDNYSKELKEKLEEYKNLAFKKDLNDDEKARRAELRIEFKNASNDLAKELKDEFNVIEEKRKKLNDSGK
ncbi:AAA family ATPase [Clostridium botulinum]|uniref:AAA family ATPase n=1 Tax=Clostridium botulinum TaxID=1491 RepID=UPI000774AA0F|nr:AAA family ATPase [Clostridium botulinum]MBY6951039.1 AAA family ATPase [Clostridium botulinum]MCR1140299.1 AAA family ATPase [Clostridium botulinum]NEZ79941.1 AAA family ATPase [Clostridium botulinum]NFA17956.1 AAA family ATPase [Clostridium botulinum]NFA54511.1 AAA family ATPase [Clostridium botulinum]